MCRARRPEKGNGVFDYDCIQAHQRSKVREIYDNGDSLIMVATDRISAFDVILKNKVTKKGTVLTR